MTAHGQKPAAGAYGDVRASDADRERAVDVLNAAFAEGRMTNDEHSARVGQAYSAVTYGELAAVVADLPAGPLGTLPYPHAPATALRAPAAPRTNTLAVASLVCALIPGIPQLAAVILGIHAHRQIRRNGERGAALATAGLTISGLGLLLAVLYLIVL